MSFNMTKEEYRQLIQEYMDKYDISYANAKQHIIYKQMLKYEEDFNTTYEKAFIQTCNDTNYNISMV